MLNKNKSSKSYFSCRPTRVLEFFLVYCLLLLPSTIFPRLGAEKNKDSWNHAAGFLVGMAWCEFWNTQTVYKVLWTKKNKMARSWHTSSDWPLAFPGWFWMNRVRSTSSLSLLFSFWSVTVPGILMIHNLTFQPSVFTLHFPEKQFYGSSWIHFFFYLHHLAVSLLKTVQFCRFWLNELAEETFLTRSSQGYVFFLFVRGRKQNKTNELEKRLMASPPYIPCEGGMSCPCILNGTIVWK